jgi:hypothetical protein
VNRPENQWAFAFFEGSVAAPRRVRKRPPLFAVASRISLDAADVFLGKPQKAAVFGAFPILPAGGDEHAVEQDQPEGAVLRCAGGKFLAGRAVQHRDSVLHSGVDVPVVGDDGRFAYPSECGAVIADAAGRFPQRQSAEGIARTDVLHVRCSMAGWQILVFVHPVRVAAPARDQRSAGC